MAAEELGLSVATMRRMRARGDITYRQIGSKIKYTLDDLQGYIEGAKRCGRKDDPDKSETFGYHNALIPPRGVSRGSTMLPDRLSANQLAQKTFGKRN
jgi:hypothetical protein